MKPPRLGVLVYRAEAGQSVRSDIPFWYFPLKGPGVILDETSADGDRLLVRAE
jgi:hypothetical protein